MFTSPSFRRLITSLLIAALVVIGVSNQLYKGRIAGDSEGYYAWLPTVLIHHELTFESWADSVESATGMAYLPHYLHREGEALVNKYTFGSAVLMAPFFMTGHLVALMTGQPADGFSVPYLVVIALSGLFFGFTGLWFVFRIARSYGASANFSWLLCLVLLFATNLYYYVVIQPAMSHVYSFAAIAALVWMVRRDVKDQHDGNLWKMALLLGLVLVIRPFNVVVVLALPFLFDDPGTLVAALRRAVRPANLWKIVVAGGLFPLLLVVVWELQTGYKIFYGYKGEGFVWDSPSVASLLWSYRKGWFVYTPVALTVVVGLLFMFFRRDYYRLATFLIFFSVLVYMLASWWSWWYGDGFGMRPLVDFYPILVVPVVLWLTRFYSERWKGSLITMVVLLIGLNLLQVWQLHAGILLPDNMNRSKYWHVFMKTNSVEYAGSVGLQSEDLFRGLHRDTLLTLGNDFEQQRYRWSPWVRKMVHDSALSGSWVLQYNNQFLYSLSIAIDSAALFREAQQLLVEGSFWYLEIDTNAVLFSPMVVSIQAEGDLTTFYKAASLKEVPDVTTGMWRKASYRLTVPAPDSGSELKLYLWNKYNRRFYVDDFQSTVFKLTY